MAIDFTIFAEPIRKLRAQAQHSNLGTSEVNFSTAQSALNAMLSVLQTQALVPDATAAAALTTIGEYYLKNTAPGNIDLIYNGKTFTLVAATSYCVPAPIANFFLRQAAASSLSIVQVSQTEYLASGVVLTFLE